MPANVKVVFHGNGEGGFSHIGRNPVFSSWSGDSLVVLPAMLVMLMPSRSHRDNQRKKQQFLASYLSQDLKFHKTNEKVTK